VEDNEAIRTGKLHSVPGAAHVLGQVKVTHQRAVVGEETQLAADEARDQQVSLLSDRYTAGFVTHRPVTRLAVSIDLDTGQQHLYKSANLRQGQRHS